MYPSMAVSHLARARSVPYVVSLHGMLDPWAVSNSHWKKVLAQAVYEGKHLRGASCLRALSEAEAHAIRAFGLKNPICIVPNGIHLPPDEPSGRPAWRERVPRGRKVLLYLGRIHPKKGLRYLLEAWARLAMDKAALVDEWHLVIAGWDQGGHERMLKALATRLGITDSVAFVGAQFGEDRGATYAQADAFILPSLGEGMPMVVLEAWSYRLPVVMTPQCNLAEGFEAGAAIRVDPAVDSLTVGLEALFTLSEGDTARMAAHGRKLAEERFSWSKVGAEMGGVYDWVLGGGSAPPTLWR
jgi:poly(glycerol-phosphate) alpha-glucosyltransferase